MTGVLVLLGGIALVALITGAFHLGYRLGLIDGRDLP